MDGKENKRGCMKKELRKQIYEKYNGHCAYCGQHLEYKQMQVDHIEPVERPIYQKGYENDARYIADMKRCTDEIKRKENINDLNPSCRPCNIDKHSMNIERWRQTLLNKINCLRRINNFRHMEKYGLVHVIDKPIIFYFERGTEAEP